MSRFIERRRPVWASAVTLSVMFGLGVLVALVWDGVPTWQNHGPDAGPGFVRRAANPGMYYWMTSIYAVIASGAAILACFRFPWATINHVRGLLFGLFLVMLGFVLYSYSLPTRSERARAAWTKIEKLGGTGVADDDLVAVTLANTEVHDDDLKLFADLPEVEILDLSNNPLTDECLWHLETLTSLKTLAVSGTKISPAALERYRARHPQVEIETAVASTRD